MADEPTNTTPPSPTPPEPIAPGAALTPATEPTKFVDPIAPPKEGPRSLDRAADLNQDRQRVQRERPSFGERMDRERARGAEVAASNAAKFEEAQKARIEEELGEGEERAEADANLRSELEKNAEAIKAQVADLPPPGPGMQQPNPRAVAATMDPNNPLVNPSAVDQSPRFMPPGARTPAPVAPEDTVQTQVASKPPTEEHAQAGMDNLGAANTPPPDAGEPDPKPLP